MHEMCLRVHFKRLISDLLHPVSFSVKDINKHDYTVLNVILTGDVNNDKYSNKKRKLFFFFSV